MKLALLLVSLILPASCFAQNHEAAVNLLRNPFIEDGDDNPAHWKQGKSIPGVEYSWEQENGPNGHGTLCIKKTAQRYFPIASWSQTISHTGNSPAIHITAQVKAKDAAKAILDVLFLDAEGEWILHKWVSYIGRKETDDAPANHDWKEYSGTVNIPPSTKIIVVGLQDYGPGTVWFSGVAASYADEQADESQQSVDAKPKKQVSLMGMLGEWMYPESKFNGAETADAAVSNISAIKSKAILTTKDSVDKVMDFYRKKLNVDNDGKNLSEREGERITTDRSVLIQDVSGDQKSSLFVIAINSANSSTTLVVSRADGEGITRIVWSNYRQLLTATQQPR